MSARRQWATVRNVRILLEKLSLSWRHSFSFDASADAALMSYHPHVRNSLTPTAFARAATLLPVAFRGHPQPFDVCVRFGEYGFDAVLRDAQLLAADCITFAYREEREEHLQAAVSTTSGLSFAAERANISSTVLAIQHMPLPAALSFSRIGGFGLLSLNGRQRAASEDFEYVNKTPPSAEELYAPQYAKCHAKRTTLLQPHASSASFS